MSRRKTPLLRGVLLAATVAAAVTGAGAADTAASANAPAAPDCGGDLPGLEAALAGVEVALFGEIHGTVEMPALFARAVCAAAARAPIVVALELPESNQSAIDALLADPEADTAALLSLPPWSAPVGDQYGLTSAAMLGLLRQLGRLRAAGLPLAVVAFDRRDTAGGNDDTLAGVLEAIARAEPRRQLLALTGNYHARVGVGAPWDPNLRFAGTLLRDRGLAVRSLLLAHSGGSAWICVAGESCGERALRGDALAVAPAIGRVELGAATAHAEQYDGAVWVGAITASPPAVQPPQPPPAR